MDFTQRTVSWSKLTRLRISVCGYSSRDERSESDIKDVLLNNLFAYRYFQSILNVISIILLW